MKKYYTVFSIITIFLSQSALSQEVEQSRDDKFIDRYNQFFGEKASNFELWDVNGRKINLFDLGHEVIVLDFWATWCAPCMSSIPSAKLLYDKLRASGVTDFEWINVSVDENKMKWEKAISENEFAGIHAIVDIDFATDVFHIQKFPTYIILNRNKEIVGFDVCGAYQGTLLDYYICMILEGKTISEAYKIVHAVVDGKKVGLENYYAWKDELYGNE